MFNNKLTVLAAACLSTTTIANAQSSITLGAEENSATRIVITAKGKQTEADVAAVSHIISAADIERSQAQDITELLQATSGISISRNGGRGSVSSSFVRGANSNQTLVLIDGVRVGSATLGSTELSHIPLEAIERIEVVKGPLSGLYGSDAIGGVIQIFTKKGGPKSSFIGIQAGSFGHQRLTGGTNTEHFNLSFSREENDGIDFTDTITGGNDDKDGFEETALNLSGNITFNDSSQLTLNALYAENDIEFDNTFGTDTGYKTANEISTLGAHYERKFAKFNWATSLGLTKNNSSTPVFAAFNSSIFDTKRLSLSSQADFNVSKNSSLIVGVDYYKENITTDSDFSQTERNNKGLFTQYQTSVGKTGVVANLRHDDNSAYGSDNNGSLALNYALTHNTRLTASYGTAFHAPSFNDLYFPFSGSADIQPEESKTAEISLRGNTKGNNWRVSLYDTDIKNLIEYPSPSFIATNTSSVSIQGVEFEYSTNLGGWYLNSSLDLLDAQDKTTGDQLARRPETTLKLSADRAIKKVNLGVDLIAENGRFDRDEELDSWERIDIRASYTLNPRLKIAAKLSNALDETYQLAKGFNTEERAFKMNVKYKF